MCKKQQKKSSHCSSCFYCSIGRKDTRRIPDRKQDVSAEFWLIATLKWTPWGTCCIVECVIADAPGNSIGSLRDLVQPLLLLPVITSRKIHVRGFLKDNKQLINFLFFPQKNSIVWKFHTRSWFDGDEELCLGWYILGEIFIKFLMWKILCSEKKITTNVNLMVLFVCFAWKPVESSFGSAIWKIHQQSQKAKGYREWKWTTIGLIMKQLNFLHPSMRQPQLKAMSHFWEMERELPLAFPKIH